MGREGGREGRSKRERGGVRARAINITFKMADKTKQTVTTSGWPVTI